MVKEKTGGVNKKVRDPDQIKQSAFYGSRKLVTYLGSGTASGNYPETPREKEWFSEYFFSKLICQSFPSNQKDDSVILV